MYWRAPVGLDEAVDHLTRLLEAYSPSGAEDEAVGVFLDIAASLGLEARRDAIGNAWACRGSGRLGVLVAGHVDTVPGRLEVRVEGTVLHGRGAVDAKGPLLSYLYAVAGLAEPGCRVCVAGLVGEEADSRGAWFVVSEGVRADHVLVSEPTGGAGVVIGYRGSMPCRIVCIGSGGHAAGASADESAFEKLVDSWLAVRRCRGEGVSINATIVRAGEYPNVLPAEAWARLDIRLAPGVQPSAVRSCVERSLVDGCKAVFLEYTPPVRVKPQSPTPRSLMRALIRRGVRPRLLVKRGTSDMNILYGRVSTDLAAYGPGDSRLSHTVAERIDVREVLWAAGVEADAMAELMELGR